MIIESTPEDGLIPHRRNIEVIHHCTGFTKELDSLNPIYSGGYPTGLLFGPRSLIDPRSVRHGFLNDLDIYGEDRAHQLEIKRFLDKFDWIKVIETKWAYTYIGRAEVQLIKIATGPIQDIFKDYDLATCAVSFQPADMVWKIDDRAIMSHSNKEIEILEPWILERLNTDREQSAVIQVERFLKYANRWRYDLSKSSYQRLVEIYHEFPELKMRFGRSYRLTSSGRRVSPSRTESIWPRALPLITDSAYWDPNDDRIGHLVEEDKYVTTAGAADVLATQEPTEEQDIQF